MDSTSQESSTEGMNGSPMVMGAPNGLLAENKRRKYQEPQDTKENRGTTVVRQRRFLQLSACGYIYETEQWKPKEEALYVPLCHDILLNTSNIEQFSFSSGNFFIGNTEGVYHSTVPGHVIYLWRYNETEQKLYISRSFLVTDFQILQSIKTQLSEL